MLALALVGTGLVGLCIAWVLHVRAAPPPGARGSREAGPTAKTPSIHVLSVVDIGTMRYLDARALPVSLFVDGVASTAARNSIAGLPPSSVYFWFLDGAVESRFGEMGDDDVARALGRLREPLGGATAVFVCFDGRKPGPRLDRLAKRAGVEIALELPQLIDPTAPDRNVRTMLDQAARKT